MLLETLDVKKNDIIIYSQNLFSKSKNFKIIFKDDPDKKSRKIGFEDVCNFVTEYVPKNLIVYRILTNIPNFEFDHSHYGYSLFINGSTEIIFFDPIFAVKELEEYSSSFNIPNLRFRIQQVGLTTLNRKEGKANFAEIYNVDLEAVEAQFQNDKVFVDALYAFEKTKQPVKEILTKNKIDKTRPVKSPAAKPNLRGEDESNEQKIKIKKYNLIEDNYSKEEELPRYKASGSLAEYKKAGRGAEKKVIQNKKYEKTFEVKLSENEKAKQVLDIFKSPASFK